MSITDTSVLPPSFGPSGETALGQYRKDEGIVGLTRAFTCAGARNVVASLWSVNDESTKNLMALFYKEIKKGLPYNRALANAKRALIQENRPYAHPLLLGWVCVER